MKSNPPRRQLSNDYNCYSPNPFATRFVSPGRLAWISSPVNSVASLAARFKTEYRSQAAIVGPHGSGKSTLLAHLVPLLGRVGWHQLPDKQGGQLNPEGAVVWLGLRRASQRPLSQVMATRKYWGHGGLLVVDGFEQLRPWEALCVRVTQRAAKMGLLATCHRRSRIPFLSLETLVNTSADVAAVQRLVALRLNSTAGFSPALKEELTQFQLIERLLREEQGSVREVFMRLYDLVENRRVSGRFATSYNESASKINNLVARS